MALHTIKFTYLNKYSSVNSFCLFLNFMYTESYSICCLGSALPISVCCLRFIHVTTCSSGLLFFCAHVLWLSLLILLLLDIWLVSSFWILGMTSLWPSLCVSLCGHKHSLPWGMCPKWTSWQSGWCVSQRRDVFAVSDFRFCSHALRGPSPLSFAVTCPHWKSWEQTWGQEHGMKSQKTEVNRWYHY